MPRRKVTKPTNIYWLYDARPEMVAVHGSLGEPFYCGKTVLDVQRRLNDHRSVAKRHPFGKHNLKVLECGEFLRVRTIEVVPTDLNWGTREQFWIAQLRSINPACTNTAKGGGGAAGNVWTAEQRAALSRLRKGHRHSKETRAKIARAQTRKLHLKVRMPRLLNEERKLRLLIETYRCVADLERGNSHCVKPPRLAHLANLSHRERFWYMYE